MLRSLLSLAVVLALVTAADASTITFNKATDGGSNVFTVIGDGSFTLADTPWYMDAESTRFLATSSNFSAKVSGFGAPDVVFEMFDAEIWPTFDAITLELRNPDHGKLWINIPQTGLVAGQQVPATLPGPNYWKALSMTDPSGSGPLLGTLPDSYLSVPEPASLIGMLVGAVALGLRRRK